MEILKKVDFLLASWRQQFEGVTFLQSLCQAEPSFRLMICTTLKLLNFHHRTWHIFLYQCCAREWMLLSVTQWSCFMQDEGMCVMCALLSHQRRATVWCVSPGCWLGWRRSETLSLPVWSFGLLFLVVCHKENCKLFAFDGRIWWT